MNGRWLKVGVLIALSAMILVRAAPAIADSSSNIGLNAIGLPVSFEDYNVHGLDAQVSYPSGLAYRYPYSPDSAGVISTILSLNLESPKHFGDANLKYYDIRIFYSNRYHSDVAPPNALLEIFDTWPPHGLIQMGSYSKSKSVSYSLSDVYSTGASMLGLAELENEIGIEMTVGVSESYSVPSGIYVKLYRNLYSPQEVYTATDINKMQSKMCEGGGYCRLLAVGNNWKLRYMGEIKITGKSSYLYSIPSLGVMLYSNNEKARYIDSQLQDGAVFVIVVYAHYSGKKFWVIPVETNRMVTYILGDNYPSTDHSIWYYPISSIYISN